MAEWSGYFNSQDGDRSYTAADFCEQFFGRILTNGIKNGGTNLQVVPGSDDMSVNVQPGFGMISGYPYYNDSAKNLTIDPDSQTRRDRVVMRLDLLNRLVSTELLKGTSGSNTGTALTRDGNIWELCLAEIVVNSSITVIQANNITDTRLNADLCGLIDSLFALDPAQFENQFNTWFASQQTEGFVMAVDGTRAPVWGTATVSGSVYTFTPSDIAAPDALTDGYKIAFAISANNPASPTVQIGSLAAVPIKRPGNATPAAGFFKGPSVLSLVYYNGNFYPAGEGGVELIGNATAGVVLSPYTFYNTNPDNRLTGSLVLNGSAVASKVIQGYGFYNTDARTKHIGTLQACGYWDSGFLDMTMTPVNSNEAFVYCFLEIPTPSGFAILNNQVASMIDAEFYSGTSTSKNSLAYSRGSYLFGKYLDSGWALTDYDTSEFRDFSAVINYSILRITFTAYANSGPTRARARFRLVDFRPLT